ncbi:hypothetical protein OROMI_026457 [Orobanche minor]
MKGKLRKLKAHYVPELNETVDRNLATSVLEVVLMLVRWLSKRKSKTSSDYRRVISLVNKFDPWFRILDAEDYQRLHPILESDLYISALLLVAEIKHFIVDLICEFTVVTFKEYKKNHVQIKCTRLH